MEHIVGEIKIVLGESTSYIIILVMALLGKTLVALNYPVIAACAVNTLADTVVDFLSAVDGHNDVGHFLVDKVHFFRRPGACR